MKVKVGQSCPTLYDPIDYTVHGILQARILEWVAIPFSGDQTQVSCIAGGFFTFWAVMHWACISEPIERKQVLHSNAKRQEGSLFLAR